MIRLRGSCLDGDAPIRVPGSGGCELVSVTLDQIVNNADESPFTRRGVEPSA